MPVPNGKTWARSPGRGMVASVIWPSRSRRIAPVACGASRIEPSGSQAAPAGDGASAMSLILPSATVSRRRCVPVKNDTASPAALHAGSCAPSVPARTSARSDANARRHSIVVPPRVATKTMCCWSGEIAASSASSPEPSSASGGAPSVSVSVGGGGGGTSRKCRTTGIARPTTARMSALMTQVERRTQL